MIVKPMDKDQLDKIIDKMLDLWETSDNWTQGVLANDADGNEISSTDDEAASWCLLGCYQRARWELGLLNDDVSAFQAFADRCVRPYTNHFHQGVVRFNDDVSTSFEDVRLFLKTCKDVDPQGFDPTAPSLIITDDGPQPF